MQQNRERREKKNNSVLLYFMETIPVLEPNRFRAQSHYSSSSAGCEAISRVVQRTRSDHRSTARCGRCDPHALVEFTRINRSSSRGCEPNEAYAYSNTHVSNTLQSATCDCIRSDSRVVCDAWVCNLFISRRTFLPRVLPNNFCASFEMICPNRVR